MEKSVRETICSLCPESLWNGWKNWKQNKNGQKMEQYFVSFTWCNANYVATPIRWSNNILDRLWRYLVHDNFKKSIAFYHSSLSSRRWILRTETETKIVSNNSTIQIFHFSSSLVPFFLFLSFFPSLSFLRFVSALVVYRNFGFGSSAATRDGTLVSLVVFFLCRTTHVTSHPLCTLIRTIFLFGSRWLLI